MARDTVRDGEAPPAPAGELHEGDTIARYEVRRRIGGGGMGVVYEAHDPLLDRKLAIKVLRDDAVANDLHSRMLREAQALARLSHPNVVAIYDVGKSHGRIFIAMDLVEGCNAADWVRQEPRNWGEVLDLYLRAGAGLLAAHDVGLIHRDFKPANVLVGTGGRVCVTDFGLARMAVPPPVEGSAGAFINVVTDHGAVLGSPGYMSPEQMLGRTIGPATDVFSFCVSLFESLHARRPFYGETLGDIYAAVLEGVPWLSESEVPEWLQKIIAKGLDVEPERRPVMSALLAEIEEERSLRQMARVERLLEEARPLARAAGGEAGFARVALRLLRELVSETPPTNEPTPLAEVEMSGWHVQSLLGKLGPLALASHFMAREGLGVLGDDGTVRFEPDSWYPLDAFVRAAHRLVRDLGPQGTFHIGLFTRDHGTRTGDVVQALKRIDRTYRKHLRWRGQLLSDYAGLPVPGIGSYRCEARGGSEAVVIAEGPWPCEMDRAMVSGVALRIRPDASVEHDAGEPCRRRGAPHCVFRVRWAAGHAVAGGARRLLPADSPKALLANPVGRYLVRPSWVYWYADPHLDGTLFRGQPALDDLHQVMGLWDALHHEAVARGAIFDVRDVTGVSPEVLAQVQQILAERQEVAKKVQLAVLRPQGQGQAGMIGALATGMLAMAGVQHPFEFFDEEEAGLVWLGRHDDLLVEDLRRLRTEGR
jgi:hypothetical protein